MNKEQKYRELISCIRIKAIRSTAGNMQNKNEVSKNLNRLAKFLEEVRIQQVICQISEVDRIENLRYQELLQYIDNEYDGTEEKINKICEELEKREDIDDVLKSYDRKNNKLKEEER